MLRNTVITRNTLDPKECPQMYKSRCAPGNQSCPVSTVKKKKALQGKKYKKKVPEKPKHSDQITQSTLNPEKNFLPTHSLDIVIYSTIYSSLINFVTFPIAIVWPWSRNVNRPSCWWSAYVSMGTTPTASRRAMMAWPVLC
jgi:hypothetical protein